MRSMWMPTSPVRLQLHVLQLGPLQPARMNPTVAGVIVVTLAVVNLRAAFGTTRGTTASSGEDSQAVDLSHERVSRRFGVDLQPSITFGERCTRRRTPRRSCDVDDDATGQEPADSRHTPASHDEQDAVRSQPDGQRTLCAFPRRG